MEVKDYMKLSKKRLAELLVERDALEQQYRVVKNLPFVVEPYEPPCYHGGICTNPFHDCINCPRYSLTGGITTTWANSTTRGENKQNNE